MYKQKRFIDDLTSAIHAFDVHVPGVNPMVRDAISGKARIQVHVTDESRHLLASDVSEGGTKGLCYIGDSLDLGGKAQTGTDGKVSWKLSNFICGPGPAKLDEPVSFVATARANHPIIITSDIVKTGGDLEIDVYSWELSGEPAPETRFSWRCWVHEPIAVD